MNSETEARTGAAITVVRGRAHPPLSPCVCKRRGSKTLTLRGWTLVSVRFRRLLIVRSVVQLYRGPFVGNNRPVVTCVIAGRSRFPLSLASITLRDSIPQAVRVGALSSPRPSRSCSAQNSTTSLRLLMVSERIALRTTVFEFMTGTRPRRGRRYWASAASVSC